MKYRILADSELKELEKEFIQFLVANGIDDSEWKKINNTDPDKAIELVEMFSDIVFEKAFTKVQFLEHLEPKSIKVFMFGTDKIYLIGIDSEHPEIDFRDRNVLTALASNFQEYKDKLKIYKTNKPISENREMEIFKMLKDGCLVIDEDRFKAFANLYQASL
ncbi:MAG: DUF6495 family protein [Flavobacteriales bacterium]